MQSINTIRFSNRRASPLLTDHTAFLAMLAGTAFVIAMVVVLVTSMFTDISISAWEIVGSIGPWYMAGISGWLVYTVVPMYVANGKTREFSFREWLSVGAELVATGAIAMALGFLLEKFVYGIANFPGDPGTENMFDSGYEVHLVILQYLLVFGVWFALGGFVGGSLYASDDLGWLSIPASLILAAVSGTWAYGGVGFFGVVLRIVPSHDIDRWWIQIPVSLVILVAGVLLTRRVLSTISLRNP